MFQQLLAIVLTAAVSWLVFNMLDKWYWSNPRRSYS